MEKAFRYNIVISLVLMLTLSLTSCATSITLRVQRRPAMDTTGIQRIAIVPFETTGRGALHRNAAQYATTLVTDRIRATNSFTLVSPSIINDARKRNENIENYVDALFTGQITRIDEKTTSHQGKKKNDDGEMVDYTYYVREVDVEFNYSFVRARDGTIVGPVSKTGSANDTNENINDLVSIEALVNRTIDNQLKNLYRDVAPYTTTVSRDLEKEKNKELKYQMDEALAQVKAGNYAAARQSYLSIWELNQSVAAAVNASILYEAMGETLYAADFMQQVLTVTGSPRARDVLARLNMELAEMAGLEQFNNTRSSLEKITNHAVSEVRKVLPAESRLWVHNNATANRNLANDVVDNMISGFLSCGIAVVERQMIDMVLKEQNFQMEGNVSDNDYVSIGHLAGANIIVITDIAGTGAGRRLHVRVLDIRTGNVIMQSGTGIEWRL